MLTILARKVLAARQPTMGGRWRRILKIFSIGAIFTNNITAAIMAERIQTREINMFWMGQNQTRERTN